MWLTISPLFCSFFFLLELSQFLSSLCSSLSLYFSPSTLLPTPFLLAITIGLTTTTTVYVTTAITCGSLSLASTLSLSLSLSMWATPSLLSLVYFYICKALPPSTTSFSLRGTPHSSSFVFLLWLGASLLLPNSQLLGKAFSLMFCSFLWNLIIMVCSSYWLRKFKQTSC